MSGVGYNVLTRDSVLELGLGATSADSVLLDVPFMRRDRDTDTGLVALRNVLAYYDRILDIHAMREPAVFEPVKGAGVMGIMTTARNCGMNARLASGDINQLCRWLCAGIPPIISLGSCAGQAGVMFSVVTGVDDSRQLVRLHHDSQPNRWQRVDEFMSAWEKGGRAAILVTGRSPWSMRNVLPSTALRMLVDSGLLSQESDTLAMAA